MFACSPPHDREVWRRTLQALGAAVVAETPMSPMTRRWLATRDKRGDTVTKPIVYGPSERAWLESQGLVDDDDSNTEPYTAGEPSRRYRRANVCPFCHEGGSLTRVRRGLKTCVGCGVALPWQYPRPRLRRTMVSAPWRLEAIEAATVTSTADVTSATRSCDRCGGLMTEQRETFADGAALGTDRDDDDARGETRSVAACWNGHRRYAEKPAAWTLADDIAAVNEEEQIRRARLEAAWPWALRCLGALIAEEQAAGRIEISSARDLTRKRVFTPAERKNGMSDAAKHLDGPLFHVGTERMRNAVQRVGALAEARWRAHAAVAGLAVSLGFPTPAPPSGTTDGKMGGHVLMPHHGRGVAEEVSTTASASYHRRRWTDTDRRYPRGFRDEMRWVRLLANMRYSAGF